MCVTVTPIPGLSWSGNCGGDKARAGHTSGGSRPGQKSPDGELASHGCSAGDLSISWERLDFRTETRKERAMETGRCQNWKLTLAYDGTDFHGWQVQPGRATIQGTLRSRVLY